MARPRKEIDMDTLRNLVRIQCTAQECADWFDMSTVTLDARVKEEGYAGFLEFYKTYSAEGKSSLRRAQWKSATDKLNPTMLVWLGKQMLGQKDTTYIAGPDGETPSMVVNMVQLPAKGEVKVTSGTDS